VPPGDKLYTGAEVVITDSTGAKKIKAELTALLKPKPNKSLLGLRYRLWLFNIFDEPKKPQGLIYSFKHQWGEAPVLLSLVSTQLVQSNLSNYLFGQGWLRPQATAQVINQKNTASITYSINAGTRYRIHQVYFPSDSSALTASMAADTSATLLKKGNFFNLATISSETQRIDQALKEKGYYYFEPGQLLVKADSLHQGKTDLYITYKKAVNNYNFRQWYLGDVSVYSNYTLERDSAIRKQKARKYKDYWIIDKKEKYKPHMFDKTILMHKDSLYNKSLHSLTIERLMNLGTFRFVRMAFTPDTTGQKPVLNTRIYLTPATKQSLTFEIAGNTKSSNYVGSDVSLTYRNINVFKGAEILDLKATGDFDWQVGGNQVSPNSQTFRAHASLYIPKLIPPFRVKLKRTPFIPRTILTTGVEYLRRPELYILRSLKFEAGYAWKEGKLIEHNLKILNINSIATTSTSSLFDSLLQQDYQLRTSFESQLIIGSKYQFTLNNTYLTNKKFNIVFIGSLGVSGNLASLLTKADSDTVGAKKIFGKAISQFIRTEADFRTFWKITPKWLLANRILVGAAIGYGNSVTVPYSEQFFIGGASSIRAFRIRGLGPGSYHSNDPSYGANESGELKLELNADLRYDLSKYVKLAFFADAGNIWLRKDIAEKPGSGLNKGDLFKEMAVGAGTGIRLDASVLVIRFDFAIPLRKPWYPEGSRWVFNEINFADKQWRKENLILNIGIGYPF
jgi:outer membrane protein assembly factor BamA